MVLLTLMKILVYAAGILIILLVFDSIGVFFCSLFPKLQYKVEVLGNFMKYDVIALMICTLFFLILEFFRKGAFLWF